MRKMVGFHHNNGMECKSLDVLCRILQMFVFDSGVKELMELTRQLYLFSFCQALPTVLYTRWELDSKSGKFKTSRGSLKT